MSVERRSSIIKARNVVWDSTPVRVGGYQVPRVCERPPVLIRRVELIEIKKVPVGKAYMGRLPRPEVKPVLTVSSRPQFARIKLAPIEVKPVVSQVTKTEPIQEELAVAKEVVAAVTDAVFVPQLAVAKKENPAPSYYLARASAAYQAEMSSVVPINIPNEPRDRVVEVINTAASRTGELGELYVRKFTFQPRWAGFSNLLDRCGAVGRFFKEAAANINPLSVYAIGVRI